MHQDTELSQELREVTVHQQQSGAPLCYQFICDCTAKHQHLNKVF